MDRLWRLAYRLGSAPPGCGGACAAPPTTADRGGPGAHGHREGARPAEGEGPGSVVMDLAAGGTLATTLGRAEETVVGR